MLIDQVKAFLASDDWEFREDGADRLLLTFGGKSGKWSCVAYVRESAGQLLFYSLAPMKIEPDDFKAVAEFITRANYGMFIGGFDFDLSDGTLHFRTSVDVEQDEDKLSPTLIKHLLYHNVLTMDRYLPGLRKIVEDGMSASAAIDAVEDTRS